ASCELQCDDGSCCFVRVALSCLFFFSSRRRHTRLQGDWSSDVCSSDLLQVRDIMVPRAQMVFVRRDQGAARILPVVVESGHSRFPVMDEDRDDIVGILLAKDLLRLTTASARERFDIREYMRPAVVGPESKRLNVL